MNQRTIEAYIEEIRDKKIFDWIEYELCAQDPKGFYVSIHKSPYKAFLRIHEHYDTTTNENQYSIDLCDIAQGEELLLWIEQSKNILTKEDCLEHTLKEMGINADIRGEKRMTLRDALGSRQLPENHKHCPPLEKFMRTLRETFHTNPEPVHRH